jgi:hypothetical protein
MILIVDHYQIWQIMIVLSSMQASRPPAFRAAICYTFRHTFEIGKLVRFEINFGMTCRALEDGFSITPRSVRLSQMQNDAACLSLVRKSRYDSYMIYRLPLDCLARSRA